MLPLSSVSSQQFTLFSWNKKWVESGDSFKPQLELKVEQRIEKRFRKTLSDYQLIADGDHVLVALSGGKDSLLMLELLAHRSHIFKPHFKVSAVHVRMENIPYATDTAYLEGFCRQLHIPLHIVTTHFEVREDADKPPCFLCSWYRRKEIFNLAQKLGCNKIALGHHQDDIIHTALMNLTFEGRFESMPVSLSLDKMPLTIIRPLALQHEADIKAYAEAHQFQKLIMNCPYEHDTHRTSISNLFAEMEHLNPEARYSIWHALKQA